MPQRHEAIEAHEDRPETKFRAMIGVGLVELLNGTPFVARFVPSAESLGRLVELPLERRKALPILVWLKSLVTPGRAALPGAPIEGQEGFSLKGSR